MTHYVYRLIGKRGRVIYIGCSMDLQRRLAEHRRDLRHGHLIHRVEVDGPYDKGTALRIERAAIETAQPSSNTEWTTRARRGVALHRRNRRPA